MATRSEGADRRSRPRSVARGEAGRDRKRGGLADIQRTRMIAALVEVTRERGASEVTVAHIVARSGVSRRTFYELFADREACFAAAFEEAVQHAALRVVPAFSTPGLWRERIRGALGVLLEFLEDEPGLGTLCVVDALGAGSPVLELRARVLEVLIEAVDEGCGEARRGARPTRLTAECVVGAVLAVLHARLVAGSVESVRALLGPLMGVIVLPYQGQAVAAREAAKPIEPRGPVSSSLADPLRELDMRLTYRTVQVLLAIAERPGASNRQVADAAGVSDQGQISKLLMRLEHLGLTHNTATGSNTRGEPNAWTLTPTGRQIERTVNQQSRSTPIHNA